MSDEQRRVSLLGQRESQDLELKRAAALDDPAVIAREIVGMLNAGTDEGWVWIGVRDENDIAVGVDPVEDPSSRKARLLDYLVETLEPPPTGDSVRIDVRQVDGAELDSGGAVLRVRVQSSAGAGPHALVRRSGRHYWIRVGARNRPMTRGEIAARFSEAARRRGDAAHQREAALAAAIDETLKEHRQLDGTERMWLRLRPVPSIGLDLDLDRMRPLLQRAEQTDNRPTGFNFVNPYVDPELYRDGVRLVGGERRYEIRIDDDGDVGLWVKLETLRHNQPERHLAPLVLLEHPTAVIRLARALYLRHARGKPPAGTRVIADLALFGVQGWSMKPPALGPGAGMTAYWGPISAHTYRDEPNLEWPNPLVLSLDELTAEPDHCGFRLVARVFRAFGFGEDALPDAYDRGARRLSIR